VSALKASERYFTKVMKAANDDLLVLGRNGPYASILRINPSGELISETLLKDPKSGVVFDLAEIGEGYLVAGASLEADKQTICWISKVTLSGDTILRKTYPGRFVHLASNGNVHVVVTDTPGLRGVNISALGFSKDLTRTWSTELLRDVEFIRPFDVKALGSGEFMIAGSGRTGLLWLAQLRSDGSLSWSYEAREESFPS
jgi:hypothetical protein